MDRMMRRFLLVLSLFLSGQAFADTVLPRLRPLPTLAEDGSPAGMAEVEFGKPLQVLSQDGPVLTLQQDDGQTIRVRATDVLAVPMEGLTLTPIAGLSGVDADRPDLQLWDSALQGRIFLGGAAAGGLAPPLTIPAGSDLSSLGLPVLSVDRVATSVGTPVTLVQALFPLRLRALDPMGEGAARKVVLHVMVDGSDYAKGFMLDQLRHLSRALAEGHDSITGFSRHVVYATSPARQDSGIAASGLRAEWPAEGDAGKSGALSVALAKAIGQLAEGIDPSDGATHLVLILMGPGLSDDPAALKAIKAAGARLQKLKTQGADLRGVVLVQGTPEPNPANSTILASLSGDSAGHPLGFGEDPLPALTALLSASPSGTKASNTAALCAEAAAKALPCLLPSGAPLPVGVAGALGGTADWVAVPLWLVAETAPYDLVPAGTEPVAAHDAQADIRACHATGRIWDMAAKACGPRPDQGEDQFAARLAELQAALQARTSERDAALADAAQKAETISSQSATLEQNRQTEAAQSQRLDELGAEADGLRVDLSQARDQGDALSTQLDQRTAELQAATAQIAVLTQDRDKVSAALQEAQAKAASLETQSADLNQSLEEVKAAKTKAEAEAAQQAEALQAQLAGLQSRIAALEPQLAKAQAATADLTAKREKLAAQFAEAQAAISDLSAKRDDLAAQLADAKASLADLEGERDDLTTQLADARKAQREATAQVSDLQAQVQDLSRVKADAEAKLAQAGRDLTKAKQKAETAQADDAAQIARLQAQLDDMARTSQDHSTHQSQAAAEADRQIVALREERDALIAKEAELETQIQDLAQAKRASEEKLVRATQDFDSARMQQEAAKTAAAAQIAQLQSQLADLTRQQDAQAALRAERDSLAAQVATLQAEASKAATQPAAEAQTVTTIAESDTQIHPKPRPARIQAPTAPKADTGALAALAPTQPTHGQVASRQVAPSIKAPRLKGCQFEWVGQAGRLVCP